MARERALPDVKTRFKVDYSDLTKAEKAAAQAHGQFQSGSAKSSAAAQSLQGKLSGVSNALGRLGPIGQQAGGALNSVGSSAGALGGSLGVVGGVAVVAGAALVKAAMYAEERYVALAEKVKDFQEISGASAETSSRVVHMLTAVGVSSDLVGAAIFKLNRALTSTPDKLAQIGIQAAYNRDGAIDLNETFFKVVDAYNAAGNASAKNAILFTAFGRAGREMIPVMEKGSDTLRRLEASTSLLFSQADLERVELMKIRTREVKSQWDEWIASMGAPMVEQQNNMAESMLAQAYAQKKYNDELAAGKIAVANAPSVYNRLIKSYMDEYYASEKSRESIAQSTEAMQKQKQAADDLYKSIMDNVSADEKLAGSNLDLANAQQRVDESALRVHEAQLRVTESGLRLEEAQKKYNETVREYGAKSLEARQAALDLSQAQDSQKQATFDLTRATNDERQAYIDAGKAARQHVIDQEDAAGATHDAAAETGAEIDQLEAMKNKLAPSSPLRKFLDDYINKLRNDIPRVIETQVRVAVRTSTESYNGRFASGGEPPVGRAVVVGEKGPELAVFKEPVHIYPNGATPAGAGATIVVNVAGSVKTERDLALSLREAIRRLDRENR